MTDSSLVISVIAIVIAFISLIWNITTKIMNDRHILLCYASLCYIVGDITTVKVLSINITNASKFTKFVNQPMLKLFAEKKKKGKLLYVNFSYGPIGQTSVELSPGQSVSFSTVIGDQLLDHFKDIKPNSVLEFVVNDSIKHSFRSNTISMQKVVDFYEND